MTQYKKLMDFFLGGGAEVPTQLAPLQSRGVEDCWLAGSVSGCVNLGVRSVVGRGAVQKVCHAPRGEGGLRKCDSL